MTLTVQSLEWAIQFVADHSDGDLFPRIAEMSALLANKRELANEIANKPLAQLATGAHRRFIVPKDEISYRQATQLDLQDTIILSALIFQYGNNIEARRLREGIVFSYRFLPTSDFGLYRSGSAWNDFWTQSQRRSFDNRFILYCDISDFYNQIYHHAVENQLIASGLPNQAIKWVINLLESTTAGVSRGVPIGPHAAHLIAEASLIPVDNSMLTSGLEFIRYADDIIIFCKDSKSAQRAIGTVAQILDKQQRLTLQRHKTKIYEYEKFIEFSNEMIEDRPINSDEDGLLKIISKYSRGNPYAIITFNSISESDWASISEETLTNIIYEYLNQDEVDYIRLRWFYRRISQIGHPGAISATLDNIDRLTPCFAGICSYLGSVQSIEQSQWKDIGSKLIELLKKDEIIENEYFKMSILNLFSKNRYINHFNKIAKMYNSSSSFAKREIVLAAKQNEAIDWLREMKEDFEGMDKWLKMSFLFCMHDFPRDERRVFISRFSYDRPVDQIIAKWAKNGA
ncbi:RNA-directed DNA polymerase [Bosea sp. PAMC 26642]|uniref:RNA-directed DNA polymerase n=1 Tax=Bosea sp. (strain PAMC 26642) TaxID=1792307 RepID=UPI0009EACBB0|nr:RNA-directed DNA polymerase [Bosea sp. PAMC 26642]